MEDKPELENTEEQKDSSTFDSSQADSSQADIQKKMNSQFTKVLKTFKKTNVGKNIFEKLAEINTKEIKIAFLINRFMVLNAIILIVMSEIKTELLDTIMKNVTLGFTFCDFLFTGLIVFKPTGFFINISYLLSFLKEIVILLYLFTRGKGKIFCMLSLQFILLLCCIDLAYYLILKISLKNDSKTKIDPIEETNPVKIEV